MKVLVTGGAGFIGSHVVDRLVSDGSSVVVLDNLDPQVHGDDPQIPRWLSHHIEAGSVEFSRGDVRDRAAVDAALNDVDTVIHLAAAVGVGQSMYEPDYYTSVNDFGQGVLMASMVTDPGRFKRFVVASSMSVYGEGAYSCAAHGTVYPGTRSAEQIDSGVFDVRCPECGADLKVIGTAEDKPTEVGSVYAITKKSQEELALCIGEAYQIPTFALRFFNTYGSRQALSNPYTGVAAIFLGRLKNGKGPKVFEDGHQTRDFVHVFDVADAIVQACKAPSDRSGVYNVCTGNPISILEVARVIGERLGVDATPEIVAKARIGDIRHCVGDPSRAREGLGWEARISLAEGMDELIRWSEEAPAEDRVDDSYKALEARGLVR